MKAWTKASLDICLGFRKESERVLNMIDETNLREMEVIETSMESSSATRKQATETKAS